ncbi:MAG: S-methyl-5'-thioinosine phosphorylase [Gammaproteobacteria bacterium]|nr:S-methyl-5'-thioinosine phosphorylase [Gammaproteobacteria bacterium]MDH3373577.1 S-methyl-5'-thioinosine phosphorylase [Gammaproteobacteria bacterium]MDH3408645.1 S-methyl-5'-thioinosine phosphorylase [Gammaproteobacteria bacterium]
MSAQFAIIVGSGFDAFAGGGESHEVATRFGQPSAPIQRVTFDEQLVYVLPRHGDKHTLPPHVINYRANLLALKELGVEAVIALNTVGVVSDKRLSGELAVPDQIIDYTWGRAHSIYDGEQAEFAHIEFTLPFSASVREALLAAARAAGVDCYDGGVYAATQGPRLETAAEVDRLERDGADYVGMTGMPEASLARELGIDYACLSLIVNRAAGRGQKPIHEDVESSTLTAKIQAMQVLKEFFRSR